MKNSDTEDRHQFGSSSHRSLHEVRRSLSGLNSRVSRQRPDMKRVRRVRFAETEADCPVISKPNPYTPPAKQALPPTFEEPKTSEYAFYKKLRKDAGGNFNSHTRKKQDTPVEKFEANNPIGELSSTHNPVKSDVLRRSLMPVAMVTPIKVRSPLLSRSSKLSPRESRNSGAQSRSVEVFAAKRKKLLQWALESSCSDISRCPSNKYDLVSVLLQRLIPESNETASMTCATQKTKYPELATKSQLLALEEIPESSSPHVNLAPPFAKQCLENGLSNCWSDQFRETIFTQSDTEESGSRLTQQANKFHLKCKRYFDDVTEDKKLRRLKRMRELDFDLDLTDDRKFRSLQNVRELDFDIDYLNRKEPFSGCGHLAQNQARSDFSICGNLRSFWDFSEKSLGFSYKSSFEEFDELNDLNESLFKSRQCTRLLGYHECESRNEQDFSCHSPSTILDLGPRSSTLSGYYNWSTPNPKFGTTELKSSSVLAICEGPDFPLLDSYTESYPSPGLGSQVNENRNYQVSMLDHLTLPNDNRNYPSPMSINSPRYLSLAENITSDNINRSILHSPCGNIRFMSMGFRNTIMPNLEKVRLPSCVDFNYEMKGLSPIGSVEKYPSSSQSDLQLVTEDMKGLYSSSHMRAMNDMCLERLSREAAFCHNDEDIFGTHDNSPTGLKFPVNKEMVCPMLLDNSSWIESLEMSRHY